MAFNFYDTHTLLASVQQLPPLHSFLLDRYFPTNAASDVFATDDVLVEYRKGSKKAAPFVAPRKGGITILREGYTMKRFTPAHIAPKRPLSIDDLKKRGFGEALYTNLTPAQRQGVIMLGDLDEPQKRGHGCRGNLHQRLHYARVHGRPRHLRGKGSPLL